MHCVVSPLFIPRSVGMTANLKKGGDSMPTFGNIASRMLHLQSPFGMQPYFTSIQFSNSISTSFLILQHRIQIRQYKQPCRKQAVVLLNFPYFRSPLTCSPAPSLSKRPALATVSATIPSVCNYNKEIIRRVMEFFYITLRSTAYEWGGVRSPLKRTPSWPLGIFGKLTVNSDDLE